MTEQTTVDTPSATASPNTVGAASSGVGSSANSKASMIEAAFHRAEQSLSEAGKEQDTGKQASGDSAPLSTEQAVATSNASTPTATPATTDNTDTPAHGEHDGTSGLPADASTPTADASKDQPQSLTPPDSWPKERKEEFSTLPDAGKSLLMDIYRDMERGLKQSFDKLATEKKALQNQFGFDTEQIKQLTDRARTFQSDPVSVISQLAEEAGVNVFFENQSEQIPEFDSQQDLVKWMLDKTSNSARQAAANEAKALRQQQQQAAIKQKLDAEFAEAYRAHPDLADHQEAIIKYVSGFNLPVEMAYRLATYEGLTQLAQNGQTTLAELNKTKAELEKLQKLATMPPGRADGQSQKVRTNGLDQFEAAMQRAEKALGR